MNRIEKRAIEAQAITPVIREMSRRIGDKDARDILKDINQKEAYERGRKIAKEAAKKTMDFLVDDVATWGDGGVWEMEILEQTPTTYFFNVLRCPYYEKYRELGLEEFGVELSCCRDEPFARGLDPKLKLVRTKTIMEGGDVCDFRYSREEDEDCS